MTAQAALVLDQPVASATCTTLFCIPHAGGSAAYYESFSRFFSGNVTLQPLELPGRGRRHREPLNTSLDSLRDDLFAHILPVARTAPYALFGHSMGAVLALLCAVKAQESNLPLPRALFVSGAVPPGVQLSTSLAPFASLSSDRLWEAVLELGGIPQCVADSEDFCRYLKPILHADFTAFARLAHGQPIPPLPVPISAFLGTDDIMTMDEVQAWKRLTTQAFTIRAFKGNHFYLQDNWANLAEHISRSLSPVC